MSPVPRVEERAHHAASFEDVGRLDHALIDHRFQTEVLGERLRRLTGALQRRDHKSGDRPVEPSHVVGRLSRHAAPVLAQSEARETAIQHAAGVVDLSVAHEMKAVGGHPNSLRWRVLWVG